MLELILAEVAIIACHGDAAALDGWRAALGLMHVPIAPDEIWLIGARADRASILADAGSKLPQALVLDQTDGWTAWTLTGVGAAELLSRLMLAPVPAAAPALVQGAIAGVPGKIIVGEGGYHVLVPAPVGEFLRDRFLAAGADLGVRLARPSVHQPLAIPRLMLKLFRRQTYLRFETLKPSYDVVIIGGGGHGLATAYYLAQKFGVKSVAVLERDYLGSGGTGRNTTVLRANYKTPETIRFYKQSFEMYARLSQDLDFNMLRSERGLFWLAHSEAQIRNQRERALQNQHFGVDTVYLEPAEIKRLCPVLDMTGGGKKPVLGAAYHPPGSIIRHDAVAWGYATGAQRHGVSIHQGVNVQGLTITNGRCVGVKTDQGPIGAGIVLSAVGGYVTQVADMARIQLPIVTHPLQAFVTESYYPVLDRIVASADLHIYVSQSSRGELLIGAEIDPYSSYSTRSTFPFLASCSARALDLFPFLGKLRILRQWAGVCDMTPDYSPLMGLTEVDRLVISSGWGTWGFKAIPAAGVLMAELIATGKVPPLIAPFALDRFRRDRAVPERASAGTH